MIFGIPIEQVVNTAVVTAIVTGIFLLVQTLINKKFRTPTEKQNEVQFGVSLLRDQITAAEKNAERWLDIETYLRDELRKQDADKERLAELLGEARKQIDELRTQRDELLRRLTRISEKVVKGDRITLADIAGETNDDVDEDTFPPVPVRVIEPGV
jgi:hypothetical protein